MLVGMICRECGRECKLVCRSCQAARARRGLLLHQRRFLQTWLAGELPLKVKRTIDGVLHLELFDDRWHSYCDAPMYEVTDRQLVREVPAELCAGCRKVFDELVAKAAVEGR